MSALLPANRWGLTFHHLGLAAKDPQAAAHFLLGFGYQIGALIVDPLQNVRLRMCTHDEMPNVEIISPAGSEGPLDKLIAAHEEGLVYHICYTTANLEHSWMRSSPTRPCACIPFHPPRRLYCLAASACLSIWFRVWV